MAFRLPFFRSYGSFLVNSLPGAILEVKTGKRMKPKVNAINLVNDYFFTLMLSNSVCPCQKHGSK